MVGGRGKPSLQPLLFFAALLALYLIWRVAIIG